VLFSMWLWILGMVDTNVIEDNIQDLGNNRDITLEHNYVKIKFSSPEEAEDFADVLKNFMNRDKKWDSFGQK
jgi:coenzyme F420-reducing hydrogenase delta subunit